MFGCCLGLRRLSPGVFRVLRLGVAGLGCIVRLGVQRD